jgi:putative transcriptional regulator
MTTIKHHPDLSTLMSCSAGSQPEALGAVMASHLEVCPCCAKSLADMDIVGMALFEGLVPAALNREAPVAAARGQSGADVVQVLAQRKRSEVPHALRSVIDEDLDALPWKRLAPGVWHYPIKLSESAKGDLRLIKVAPGHALPEHGHGGEELTLVLRGSYDDCTGHYGVGDVADLADDVDHAPVADATVGCICLIASERPAKFKSLLARIWQPLAGL